MKEFLLNKNTGIQFYMFNITHFLVLFITYIIMLIILYNKNKLKNISDINKKRIRISFGIILLILWIIRRGSFIYYDVYNIKNHLDLGFCNINVLLFIFYCLTGNKKMYKFCYYSTFVGPLLSILFPAVTTSINNYSFITFIINHNILFLMNLVFCIFEELKQENSNVGIFFLIGYAYVVFTNILDIVFDLNYNKLIGFISSKYVQNGIVLYISNSLLISLIIYFLVASICILIANYILQIIGGKYEKK